VDPCCRSSLCQHFIENPRVIVLSYNAQDLRNLGQAKKKFSALDIVEFSGRNGRRIASGDRPQLTSPTRAGGRPRRREAPCSDGARSSAWTRSVTADPLTAVAGAIVGTRLACRTPIPRSTGLRSRRLVWDRHGVASGSRTRRCLCLASSCALRTRLIRYYWSGTVLFSALHCKRPGTQTDDAGSW
jgi:hypothetical protein